MNITGREAIKPLKRLGKLLPRRDRRTLRLVNYLPSQVWHPLDIGPDCQYKSRVPYWPMYANDVLGDCVIAAAGHCIEQWRTYAHRTDRVISDEAVLQGYGAVGGYIPGEPSTDQGCSMMDALNYWRQIGFGGHTIRAYMAVEPSSGILVRDAIYLFGNLYIGLALPLSAYKQDVWDVPPEGLHGTGRPGSWGGHCVPVVSFHRSGLECVTWGGLQKMTWDFFRAYTDEAYAVLSRDWINSTTQLSASGFDFQTLNYDLKHI